MGRVKVALEGGCRGLESRGRDWSKLAAAGGAREKRMNKRVGRSCDEWTASLCHRRDGQLQPEYAPMHCRWSGHCFEWLENIPLLFALRGEISGSV